MTPEERRNVAKAFTLLISYYNPQGQPLSLDVAMAYADDLDDLPFHGVIEAMRRMRRDRSQRRAPLPADIRDLVRPDGAVSAQARANMIAGEITSSVSRFGYNNAERARAHLGELGWRVVQAKGGWPSICAGLTVDSTASFHAQCRDIAMGLIEVERRAGPPGDRVVDSVLQKGCETGALDGMQPLRNLIGRVFHDGEGSQAPRAGEGSGAGSMRDGGPADAGRRDDERPDSVGVPGGGVQRRGR